MDNNYPAWAIVKKVSEKEIILDLYEQLEGAENVFLHDYVWVKGVGSKRAMFQPLPNGGVGGCVVNFLLCAYNDEVQIYTSDTGEEYGCEYWQMLATENIAAIPSFSKILRNGQILILRGDKTYLGNRSLRVYSDESASAKIFVEFIALVMRNRIHTRLKNAKLKNERKRNFMNVTAAIHELEKIEMIRRPDGRYTLDHAVTATQKEILSAFGLDEKFIMESAAELSTEIAKSEKEAVNGED